MKKKLLLMAIALIGLTGITAQAQETQARQEAPVAQNKMRQPREFTEFAFEGILLDINQQQRIDSLNAAVKANRPGRPDRACCANDSADCTKAECQKADCKKGDCRKADCKKADCKKDNCNQGQCNQGQCNQGQCTKPESCAKDDKNCENAQCAGAAPCKDMKRADGDRRGKGPKGNGMRMHNPYGKEYVAKVKEILTPDQFVIFEENLSNMPMNMKNADPRLRNANSAADMSKNCKMKGDKKKSDKMKLDKKKSDKKSKKETK